jgi:hypothetical protein
LKKWENVKITLVVRHGKGRNGNFHAKFETPKKTIIQSRTQIQMALNV